MRRLVDFVSFVLLGLVLLVTGFAIFGPSKLPLKVPTHLNDLGLADAWAARSSYEVLPMIAVIAYLALTVFAAYSTLAKHAAEANPESGPPLEALVLKLITWIKVELMAIFLCLQLSSLHTVRHLDDPTSIWTTCMWAILAGVLGTVAWFVTAMIRTERSEAVQQQKQAAS
jgi:uncharacterized membrane protein